MTVVQAMTGSGGWPMTILMTPDKEPFYAGVVKEIIAYVLRDMTAVEGGFLSAEDADSEGVEGKFYLWTVHEIKDIFGQEDAELFIKAFNVKDDGNFQEAGPGINIEENILHLQKPLPELAKTYGISEKQLQRRLESGRLKLFQERKKRIHPFKDDKILTDWNGLMIAALAKAGNALMTRQPQPTSPIYPPLPGQWSRGTDRQPPTSARILPADCRLPTTSIDQMLKNLRPDIGV
jgi:uncharacterized protein YyaL (SSP411 family)